MKSSYHEIPSAGFAHNPDFFVLLTDRFSPCREGFGRRVATVAHFISDAFLLSYCSAECGDIASSRAFSVQVRVAAINEDDLPGCVTGTW